MHSKRIPSTGVPRPRFFSGIIVSARFWLATAVVAGLFLRLFFLMERSRFPDFSVYYPGLDGELYHLLAKRIASGDLFLGNEAYFFSPLYAYFLGGAYFLFGDSAWTARVVNVLLGTATVGLVFGYAREFFKSAAVASIAAWLVAVYGPFVVFDTSCLKASFGQFVSALSLFLIAKASKNGRMSLWLASGAALGAALHMSAFIASFILALVALLLVHPPAKKAALAGNLFARVLPVATLIAGVATTTAPFALRNFLVAKEPVFLTSTGGIHLYIGNHLGADGVYRQINGIRSNAVGHFCDARKEAEKILGKTLSAAETSSYWKKRATDFMVDEPMEFLKLAGKKALLTLSPYEIPNNENYRYVTARSDLSALFLNANIAIPLGFAGLVLALFASPRPWVPVLYTTCAVFSLCLLFVNWRYRLPAFLTLLPFAAYFSTRIFEFCLEKRYVKAGCALLSALLLALSGQAAPDAKQKSAYWTDAERKMESVALQANIMDSLSAPSKGRGKDRALLWHRLALVKSGRQDVDGAVRVLRQGLSEFPGHPLLIRRLKQIEKQYFACHPTIFPPR